MDRAAPSYRKTIGVFMLEFSIALIPFSLVAGMVWALLGFSYSDAAAILLSMALVAAYFFVGDMFFGGTVLRRLFSLVQKREYWRSIVSFMLDFLTAFWVPGYVVAWWTGQLRGWFFDVQGLWALAVFGVLLGYFVIGNAMFGGTPWRRIFGVSAGSGRGRS